MVDKFDLLVIMTGGKIDSSLFSVPQDGVLLLILTIIFLLLY